MALPQEKHYTFADLLSWNDDVRYELIEGVPVMMSPPRRVHQIISRQLLLQIGNYLEGKQCEVYQAPFGVRLFEAEGDSPYDSDTLVEPDLSVICDPTKLDEYGCKGAPDMVVEILSPTNRRHDCLVKFIQYQRAGVQEYWIVDPEKQVVLVYQLEDGQYYVPEVYTSKDTVPVGVLEDCTVDLTSVFSEA